MAGNKKTGIAKKINAQNIIIVVLIIAILAVVAAITSFFIVDESGKEQLKASLSQAEIEKTNPEKTISKSKKTTDKKEKTTEKATEKTTEKTTAKPKESTAKETTSTTQESKVQIANNITEPSKQASASKNENGRIVVNPQNSKWNLIVVNSGREIPKGYVPTVKRVCGSDRELDYRVAPYYEQMYNDAKKDGITLVPYSGYRTYNRQQINYESLTNTYMSRYGISRQEAAKRAATVILPPGTSEHNLGLAMDICNTYDSFANTKEFAWLQKNADKYGFILRYTAEKQGVTGIVPEPWHWRFVGTEYSTKIKQSGLCLEEYLDSVGIAY